jgi:hypothetical protein
MRAYAQSFRQPLPEKMQHIAFMQSGAPPRASQRDFAAAEGSFTGQQRVKVNAAPAVVVEYQFIIAYL